MLVMSEWIFVVFIILGVVYTLINQVRSTTKYRKRIGEKTQNYKKAFFWSILACVSLTGFLVSYVVNITIRFQQVTGTALIPTQTTTSNTSVLGCFIFLLLFIATKSIVVSGRSRQTDLLNFRFRK